MAPARTAEPVQLTVAASGDFLIHEPIWERARADGGGRRYDFRRMLRFVRPIVRGADLALCHVETPMSGGPPAGYPRFNTPPALAGAIKWAGYDVCSTASNHSLDQGQSGIRTTVRPWAARASRTRVLRLRRRAEALDDRHRQGSEGRVPVLHRDDQRDPVATPVVGQPCARPADPGRRAPCPPPRRQVVVVNLHWGNEFRSRPSQFQRRLRRPATRSDAVTAVVGQHAHVVQPISRVNGRLVVFGEGNLLSNQSADCCPAASQDGLIAMLRISVTRARRSSRGSTTCRRGFAVPTTRCCPSGSACAATSRPHACSGRQDTGRSPSRAAHVG